MEGGNYSVVTEFIIVGLSSDPLLQFPLFSFFFMVYMITVIGNLLLIAAVRIDSRLHKPMYLFLVNLSFLDICSTSTTAPMMLVNFQTGNRRISVVGCFIQVASFVFLVETECILLTFMAYDRYVAICIPLHYCTIMNTVTCVKMLSVSWLIGAIISFADIYVLFQLKYCGPNIINHFFCEGPSLMQISCSDLSLMNIVKLLSGFLLILAPLSFITYSYIHIIIAVFRIQSKRYKTFSTCASHLTVVIIFYGSGIITYMNPEYKGTLSDKIFSVFYTAITPMLNPLIYSLRNKEVHGALQNLKKFLFIPKRPKS